MKLIIDIPEEDYNFIKKQIADGITNPLKVRIANGVPIKQEPNTGHWITTRTFMHDGEFYCDICKCDAPSNEKWDYCPNCGAKMEG